MQSWIYSMLLCVMWCGVLILWMLRLMLIDSVDVDSVDVWV